MARSKTGRIPWRDGLLLMEAIIWLILTSLAISVLPFRYVIAVASRPPRRSAPPLALRAAVTSGVRWAILAGARRVWWHTACFQQGLAAHLMLRRRGIPSALYYGAVPGTNGEPKAHVWVQDDTSDVVGGEFAADFAVLATFPNQGPRGGCRQSLVHETIRPRSQMSTGNLTPIPTCTNN